MVLTVSPAQAIMLTWNFDVPTGPGAVSQDHFDTTFGTFKITASGFNTSNAAPSSGNWTLAGVTPNALFGKFTSGDPSETGLGLANKPNNEIQPATLIQLDLIDLINKGVTDEVKVISSVQDAETLEIFRSNIAAANGATGTFQVAGTGLPAIRTFTFPGPITSRYEWVTATSGDVLLTNGLGAMAVPEPTTLLLLGFGLVGLAGFRREFKK